MVKFWVQNFDVFLENICQVLMLGIYCIFIHQYDQKDQNLSPGITQ